MISQPLKTSQIDQSGVGRSNVFLVNQNYATNKKNITSASTWLVNKKQISQPLKTSQIDQSGGVTLNKGKIFMKNIFVDKEMVFKKWDKKI